MTEFQVILLAAAAVIIAVIMEWYKTKLRCGKCKAWEIRVIAFLITAIFTITIYFGFELPGKTITLIFYTGAVFAIQWFLNMQVVKKIVKAAAKNMLKKKGIDIDE